METLKGQERKTERMLRFAEIKERSGLAKSTLYKEIKAERFPAPHKLTARSVGWKESEITAWVENRNKKNHSECVEQN